MVGSLPTDTKEAEGVQLMIHYFAKDGSYGDATNIVIAHTDNWNESDWDKILDSTDSERASIATEIADSKKDNQRLLGL